MIQGMVASLRKWFEGLGKQQKLFVAALAFSLISTIALFSIGDASSVTKDPLGSTPFYFVSAFLKLIAVLVLIVGVSIFARRWIQPGAGINSTRQLQLLETIRLSPKQALHLVAIGNQKLLIGATDQSVSLIAPVDEDLWFSGIFRDAPPNVGRIANPTYAAPPDMLVYHGNSQ
jgi:flagellar biosynthetic protein FliO